MATAKAPDPTRRALLERGLELVVERGPEGVTTEALVERSGVDPATVRQHFEDEEHLRSLVAQVAREAIGTWMIDAAESAELTDDPHESARLRFRAVGEAYLDFALVEPTLFSMAFLHSAARAGAPDEPDPWGVLTDAMEELVLDGQLSTERLIDGPIIGWAAVHGLATIFVQTGVTDSSEARNDIAMLLEGVGRALGLAPPGPERRIELNDLDRRDSVIRPDRDLEPPSA